MTGSDEEPRRIQIALLAGAGATLIAVGVLYIGMVFALAMQAKNSGLDFGSRFLFGLFVAPIGILFTLAYEPSRQAFLASPWAVALISGIIAAVLIGVVTSVVVLNRSRRSKQ